MKKWVKIFGVMVMLEFVFYGCGGGGGEECPSKDGYVLCGYCKEDVLTSSNPNAGKCIYCPVGSTCSTNDACDINLKCITSGGGGGGGGVSLACQYCSKGDCLSNGHCCPSSHPYYCSDGYCHANCDYSACGSSCTAYCCY
jgi:hypothetical protein